MEFGSGSEEIGTKRTPEPGHALECAFECASALERALECANVFVEHELELASLPASLLYFSSEDSSEDEGPLFAQALDLAQALTCVLQPMVAVPQNQPFDLNVVSADSDIMHIINSIKSYHHYQLACALWPHPPQTKHKYSWLLHFIAPITRLPCELLQQILLIVINEVSNSPLVLVHVCKHWHTMVTSIWASLRLGTRTTKEDVIWKLEGGQWLLDILVDTEMDCGDFTSSYKAIFTAIEAASRWRSFVVETFPGQADLPEDLVNHGLQQCSNPSMNRLRTFKIKCNHKVSPLLDRLLCILGTTASSELMRVESIQ